MACVLLFVYVISTMYIALAVPFEDDPNYFRYHHANQFTAVDEVLFVKQQSSNPILYPATPCQALRKHGQVERHAFLYEVYYVRPWTQNILTSFTTRLTTSRTPPHRRDNVVTYQTVRGGAFTAFKVMFADWQKGCFILVFSQGQFGRGCRLLRTGSTVRQSVPDDCWQVYAENCPWKDIQIYDRSCGERILRIGT